MNFRKVAVVFFLLLGCAFLGPDLLLRGGFWMARSFLKVSQGWDFQADRISWQRGGIFLENGSLKGAPFFSFDSANIDLFFREKKIVLTHPHLTLHSAVSGGKTLNWDITIVDGYLDEACASSFNIEYKAFSQSIQGSFRAIDLAHFPFESSLDWKGLSSGSFHFTKTGAGNWQGGIQGEIQELSGDPLLKTAIVTFEGEGVYGHERADWQGFLRLTLEQGELSFAGHQIEHLEGNFHWHGPFGIAWKGKGVCEGKNLSFSGKGVLRSSSFSPRWLETVLEWDHAKVSLQAEENHAATQLEIQLVSVDPKMFQFLKEGVALFSPSFPFSLEEGLLSLEGRLTWKEGEIENWEVISFDASSFRLRGLPSDLFCKRATCQKGVYAFEGGEFGPFRWHGEGHLEQKQGRLCVSHELGEATVHFAGSAEGFHGTCKTEGVLSGELPFSGVWSEDGVHVYVQEGKGDLFSLLPLAEIGFILDTDWTRFSLFEVRADILTKDPFFLYAPVLETEGVFDVRLGQNALEWVRLAGLFQEQSVQIDPKKSFCGNTLIRGRYEQGSFSVETKVPHTLIQEIIKRPWEEDLLLRLRYDSDLGLNLSLLGDTTALHVTGKDQSFRLEHGSLLGVEASCDVTFSNHRLLLQQGKLKYKEALRSLFCGFFHSPSDWGIELSSIEIDASCLGPEVKGGLQGIGTIGCHPEIYSSHQNSHNLSGSSIQGDFDLTAHSCHWEGFSVSNAESLHVHMDLSKGIGVRGLHLIAETPESSAFFDCKVGFLAFDPFAKELQLLGVSTHFKGNHPILSRYAPSLSLPEKNLHLEGDIRLSFEPFSYFCTLQEGLVPLQGDVFPVRDVCVEGNLEEIQAHFSILYQSLWIPADLTLHLGDISYGSCVLQDHLKIDFLHEKEWEIQSIEGSFSGFDGAFRQNKEGGLIGRARLNCHALSQIVPPSVASVFRELKMGDGYEVMGKFQMAQEGLSFQGIVSGKQVEFFGFEFKTLLAQMEFSPEHVRVEDLTISDFALSLVIPKIEAKGTQTTPWTLSVPLLTIREMRPSLLHAPGKKSDPLTPLVIRELKLEELNGFLDDSSTYRAKGELHFINSYKRSNSIFELPAAWLSRIVGLDLDLLVPVRGTVRYELQKGKFYLTELMNAYSENERSEFFLVFGEDTPTVDLDWNLNILIQMKQFVLFKFTEAFVIAVTGNLEKPEFRLHSKKKILNLSY